MPLTSGRKLRTTYILPDPSSHYARAFIRRIYIAYGIRPICAYTSSYERFCLEREHPILRSSLIEAAHDVRDWSAFADSIRDRYHVVAVIPHVETAVEVTAALGEYLNIDWNPPALIRMFRDKVLLKRHLAAAGIRVPQFRPIESPDDLATAELPDRFVLKPVDGYGNRMIGVFGRDELEAARRHLDFEPGVRWMLEEFVAGLEFSINGQVRTGGEVEIYGINEYRRCTVGSCHTVYDHEFLCPTTHPRFQELLDFAVATMKVTGLRRSPFHLEAIVDSHGPCVIDLGARLGGGLVELMSLAHPELPDVLTIAAHDYIEPNDLAVGNVRWDDHDQRLTMTVYGIAKQRTVIHCLHGVKEIEAMPQFLRWHIRPAIGDKVYPTDQLYSTPYWLDVWAPANEAERIALVERIRGTIGWNERSSRVAEWLALIRRKATRLPHRLLWLLHRVGRSDNGPL